MILIDLQKAFDTLSLDILKFTESAVGTSSGNIAYNRKLLKPR